MNALEVFLNFGIALCYFAIPVSTCVLCWRRWNTLEPFVREALIVLAIFIAACGSGHLLTALSLFWPQLHPAAMGVHALTLFVSAIAALKIHQFVGTAIEHMDMAQAIARELRKSELRFQLFADSSPAIKFIKNVSGHCFWGNQRWKDELGDITSDSGLKLLGDERDLAVWESPNPVTQIEEVVEPSGVTKFWQIVKFPIRFDLYDSNDQRFIGCIAFDVSQRVEANRQLLEYSAELQRSNEDLESFSYIISHDLKAPLRSIIGFSERLESNLILEERQAKYLRNVLEAANWMQGLIEDLLMFSRVTRQKPVLDAVNFAEVVDQSLILLANLVQEKQARIQNYLSDGLTVRGDRAQLVQVVQNLIGNAIKFVPPERTPVVTISSQKRDNTWLISISDNGIGIEERFQEKVFTLFQRLHNKEEFEGTGVGLAICQKIVERHGGSINVVSRVGSGSIFTISLTAEE